MSDGSPQLKPRSNFDKFNGVDIQFRRSGTDWPKPYRVTVMTNKNERAENRTVVFCDTLDEAIRAANGQTIANAEQQEPVGEVYRYGADSHGRKWHGIFWYDADLDVPTGTKLYVKKNNT